jgi:AAA15 family ATPase/GTPase
MENIIVRMLSVELNHFKNVEHGLVELSRSTDVELKDMQSDILGIYGQNGSGKTAVVDAVEFLQLLLLGMPIRTDSAEYISKSSNSSSITFSFLILHNDLRIKVNYMVTIKRGEEGLSEIAGEVLNFSECIDTKWSKISDIINYDPNSDGVLFTPVYRYKEMSSDKDNLLNMNVAKVVSRKNRSSFIFIDEGIKAFSRGFSNSSLFQLILTSLRHFAKYNLFVINNAHSSVISLHLIPFSYKFEDERGMQKGDLLITLNEPAIIPKEKLNILSGIIREMNIAIKALIPDMQVEIKDYGPQLMKNGLEGIRCELVSVRGNARIPLRYESEGIKKLLSILNVCIAIYNNPAICLVADELDAGIFEYLLGEILNILEESGKGQLLFTSHNLRPLEMLNKSSLIFTTTNPDNRYIRLANVKTTNNLRDLYLRSINLGGQKEAVYQTTNAFEISHAFHNAGKRIRL